MRQKRKCAGGTPGSKSRWCCQPQYQPPEGKEAAEGAGKYRVCRFGKLTEEQKEDIRQKALEKELAKGGLSGDPNRPYSRGRAYDPNRYGKHAEEKQNTETETVEETQQADDSADSK